MFGSGNRSAVGVEEVPGFSGAVRRVIVSSAAVEVRERGSDERRASKCGAGAKTEVVESERDTLECTRPVDA